MKITVFNSLLTAEYLNNARNMHFQIAAQFTICFDRLTPIINNYCCMNALLLQ